MKLLAYNADIQVWEPVFEYKGKHILNTDDEVLRPRGD